VLTIETSIKEICAKLAFFLNIVILFIV